MNAKDTAPLEIHPVLPIPFPSAPSARGKPLAFPLPMRKVLPGSVVHGATDGAYPVALRSRDGPTRGHWGHGVGQSPWGQGPTLGRFARTCAAFPRAPPPPGRIRMDRSPRLPLPPGSLGLGVESKRRRAESQWIVAARPLCHLQYPVAYLSRLQRILPAARVELRFKAARAAHPARGPSQSHVPLGAMPLPRVGDRAARARIASSPDSDLEAFSHNPAHGSFAPLAFQPSAMTNCANQRFLSY